VLEPERSEADRLELARALRDLRGSGLTGEALGRRIYMSQAKISRIETGRITPSVTDVELIVHALRAEPERSRELVDLAASSGTSCRPC
jgi:transcriptional regulator with XRE-family HTH domain